MSLDQAHPLCGHNRSCAQAQLQWIGDICSFWGAMGRVVNISSSSLIYHRAMRGCEKQYSDTPPPFHPAHKASTRGEDRVRSPRKTELEPLIKST